LVSVSSSNGCVEGALEWAPLRLVPKARDLKVSPNLCGIDAAKNSLRDTATFLAREGYCTLLMFRVVFNQFKKYAEPTLTKN